MTEAENYLAELAVRRQVIQTSLNEPFPAEIINLTSEYDMFPTEYLIVARELAFLDRESADSIKYNSLILDLSAREEDKNPEVKFAGKQRLMIQLKGDIVTRKRLPASDFAWSVDGWAYLANQEVWVSNLKREFPSTQSFLSFLANYSTAQYTIEMISRSMWNNTTLRLLAFFRENNFDAYKGGVYALQILSDKWETTMFPPYALPRPHLAVPNWKKAII